MFCWECRDFRLEFFNRPVEISIDLIYTGNDFDRETENYKITKQFIDTQLIMGGFIDGKMPPF